MPPVEGRQVGIARPRQSLSCLVCRRRKVRCGREQPACSNCVRFREACEYESDPPDTADRQAKRKNTRGSSQGETVSEGLSPMGTDVPFPGWSGHQPHLTTNIGIGVEAEEVSVQASASCNASSDTLSNDRRNGSTISSGNHHLGRTQPDLSNTFLPQSRPQSLGAASPNMLSWHTYSQEDLRNPLQLATPALTTSTTEDSISSPPQKRQRTTDHYELSQESTKGQGMVLESPRQRQQRIATSPDLEALDFDEDRPRSIGYLSIQNGGRIRHVDDMFWGLIRGHESLFETVLNERFDVPDNVPMPYIDSLGLANLLTTLPNKASCDSLFQSFLIAVYPVHPLIHIPTFQTDYNNFWQWCRNSDISQPDNKLLDDPTFLCLLFSVLYCGAAVSSAAAWDTGCLRELEKKSTVEQLRKSYLSSSSMCQSLQHPTFFTLVSSLLAHSCSEPETTKFGDLKFVSMISNIAQSMGLHHDGTLFGFDPITSELRRRVWWHIVWLDLHASMIQGLQACCIGTKAQSDVKMVSETRDEDLSRMTNTSASRDSAQSPSATSVTMLLAIGRFETVRLKQFLTNHLDSPCGLGQTQFRKFFSAAKSLQLRLDKLIERIPVQGISETGFIPSRLANASPVTHEWLYSDRPGQATIWSSWARNMLTLLKTEVAILVQKPFLARADSKSKQQQRMWNSVIQLCIAHLRNFMQLVRIPAFAPYLWFCLKYQAPIQPVFLTLTFLKYNKNYGDGNLARHFADEVIDVFNSPMDLPVPQHGEGGQAPDISSVNSSEQRQVPLPWGMLANLRNKIEDPLGEAQYKSKPLTPTRCQLVPPAIALRAMSLSTNEKSISASITTLPTTASLNPAPISAANGPMFPTPDAPPLGNGQFESGSGDINAENDLQDISDLEAWCSSLTQNPGAYLQKGQELVESVHKATSSSYPVIEAGSAEFGEMLDYFRS